MQQDNLYMWTPNSDVSSQVGPMDEDLELFSRLSYLPSNGYLPMVAPLNSPPSDLSDAVSRMNMNDQHGKQRNSLSSNLSLEITPGISITEATPLTTRAPGLALVDDFLNKHFGALASDVEQQQFTNQQYANQQYTNQQYTDQQLQLQQQYHQQQLQQQQQHQQQLQQEQQQHESFTRLMDPTGIDNLLIAEPGQPDWLSWTPVMGSPASNYSTSFDDQTSIYSTSPEPSSYFTQSMSLEDLIHPNNYPSPSRSDMNNNTLTVRKPNRSRRVSEPPKPTIVQEQFSMSTDRSIRRTNSDKRARSNSNASSATGSSGNHHCLHPGCGKSFTRPYNLTSHMRTHTSDRPFACSQCGRKFARQHDRNRHEKLHWGIKPYACSNCKKPFARMDALNRHLRVENGCSSHPPL